METVSRLLLTFLLNSIWQVTVLIAATVLCDRLLQNGQVRYRHLLWVTALLLSILLPLLSLKGSFITVAGSNRLLDSASPNFAQAPSGSTAGSTWLGDLLNSHIRTISLCWPLASTVVACYLLFLLYKIIMLLRAWRRASYIGKAAYPSTIPEWMATAIKSCRVAFRITNVSVLCSPDMDGPLTIGYRHPLIILPEILFNRASSELLLSILGHEMAHIKRNDFFLNIVYEILYLPISFHPAAALARRGINETREMACDEMVAGDLVDTYNYANSLVDMAKFIASSCGHDYTLGVFDANILEERVMRLIERRPRASERLAKLLFVAVSIILVTAGVTVSAFSLRLQQEDGSATITERSIVGIWNLFPTMDGKPDRDDTPNDHQITLTLKIENNRLAGIATTWSGDQKNEWQLITPKFDGKTFSFKVYNGEELLEGSMQLVNDKFEGRWTSSESKLSGKLKMIRQE